MLQPSGQLTITIFTAKDEKHNVALRESDQVNKSKLLKIFLL